MDTMRSTPDGYFAHAFHIDPTSIPGASLFALGAGEWDVPQLRSLLRATLSGAANVGAYEMDLTRSGQPPRRLVVTAHALDYSDPGNVRLLLAVSDVTDARLAERLKDDLLREKAILFQELQHRVANSLQIIASVLMQTARRAPSAETKGILHDAHSRVMSVATLQRQLAASSLADVELRTYFTELCASIGASMIHDHEKLSLVVRADEGTASADVSVSLGLIVTELVINALKYAFPDPDKVGTVAVRYEVNRSDWKLSVADNGIGHADGSPPARGGLGTSLVKALAHQLDAKVESLSGPHGMNVSVTHSTFVSRLPA